jgi:uncharacterized membrane protein
MMRVAVRKRSFIPFILIIFYLCSYVSGVWAQGPVVRAVMFWMEGCMHCHYVLQNVISPLQEKYGEQLEIRFIEIVTVEEVDLIYEVAAAYGISKEDVGVPFLIIGEEVLVGSDEMEGDLPDLIEKYLAAGGVDYPEISILVEALPNYSTQNPGGSPFIVETMTEEEIEPSDIPTEISTNTPAVTRTTTIAGKSNTTPTDITLSTMTVTPTSFQSAATEVPLSNTKSPEELFLKKEAGSTGFALAFVLLIGMVIAVVFVGVVLWHSVRNKAASQRAAWTAPSILILALLGLAVAVYLSYVEIQLVEAFCGPVGDCNAVQGSSYARLFGLIPIGILGVFVYLAILGAWLWGKMRDDRWSGYTYRIIFILSLIGTLFSIYLTFLEPFVIKAVCSWCLASALIMTLIMLVSVSPAVIEALGERNS